MPDPALVYRRPNAPRPRSEAAPATTAPAIGAPVTPAAVPDTALRDAIKHAVSHSDSLLDGGRFAQAAEVLHKVIAPAAEALGAESTRVLRLRQRRAAILILAGDFRRTLPEFDALVTAYTRTAGPTSSDALACLQQAAHCRAEMGEVTVALRQFRQVLAQVRVDEGDASELALDLRRSVGVLLLADGQTAVAMAELQPLYQDFCLVYGPDHEYAKEVAAILTRLRLAEG